LGYSITNDLITGVMLSDQEKQTLYQTDQNIAKQKSYELTLAYPTRLAKFWNMDNSLTSTYNQTTSPDLNGLDYNRNKLSFMINTNHNFTISPTSTAELSGSYIASQIYGTYEIRPYYGMDLGIKKSFMNNKLNLKFALNDIFDTRKARISSAVSNLNYNLNQKIESRIYRLSINYVFGSSGVKAAGERKTGVTEEEGRIKK
jgi:hypothetical protein